MCLEERNTDRRGRPPAYLASERRTRCVRRSNWLSLWSMGGASLLLAFLAVDVLATVADALALIWLGEMEGKIAFRPLHLHGLTVDGRSHACGHDDRVSADAGHRQSYLSLGLLGAGSHTNRLRTRCTGSRRRRSLHAHVRPTSRPWVSTGWRRPAHSPRW